MARIPPRRRRKVKPELTTRPSTDLTKRAGNPTFEIQKHYDELMSIADVDELVQHAVQIVEPTVGAGFSERNYRKFMMNINRARERGVSEVQRFLTNFLLAGAGMKAMEDIDAIASFVTEDIEEKVELTEKQRALKEMVEKYGYQIGLLE